VDARPATPKTELTAVPAVGGTCVHCHMFVKTRQQSGTILAQHLFGCQLAQLSIQQMAWDACSMLRKCEACPIDSSDAAARPAPGVSRICGAVSGAGSAVVSPQLLGSQPPGVGITAFLDCVSPAQVSTINAAIIEFFVAKCVPFRVVESPTFATMLRAMRPAYV